MGKVLECIHECDAAKEILIEGSNGECSFNIFTDLVSGLWEGHVLCTFSR